MSSTVGEFNAAREGLRLLEVAMQVDSQTVVEMHLRQFEREFERFLHQQRELDSLRNEDHSLNNDLMSDFSSWASSDDLFLSDDDSYEDDDESLSDNHHPCAANDHCSHAAGFQGGYNPDLYVTCPSLQEQASDVAAPAGAAVCIICQIHLPRCAAVPCMHVSYCATCARRLCLDRDKQQPKRRGQVSCAKCRQQVQAIARIYLE